MNVRDFSQQSELVISTLGPQGSYSERASKVFAARLGLPCKIELRPTVSDSLSSVANHESGLAIVPWYNSVDGLVGSHVDDLLDLQDFLKIYDEVIIGIKHYLASSKIVPLQSLKKVYSHPSALQQCRNNLRTKLPDAHLISVSSTSEGARLVKEDDSNQTAAICSLESVQRLGLEILDEDIQDYATNETRFFACTMHDHERTGDDRTLIVVRWGVDKPGQLHRTVSEIAERNINLHLIQSRPYRITPEEFLMVLGLAGHRTDKNVRDALGAIREQTLETNGWLRILGSYPRREREVASESNDNK